MTRSYGNVPHIGKVCHYHGELASTNDEAKRLLRQNVAEGTVIIAANQTQGRGQYGRGWYAKDKQGLLMSVVLYPRQLVKNNHFFLSMAIALGVAEALDHFIGSARCTIKWPNDIYCGNNKIGGILIENIYQGKLLSGSVAGIGINIDQARFPTDLPNAVSLFQITGKSHPRVQVQGELFRSLEKWYRLLNEDGFPDIQDAYNQRLYKRNEEQPIINKGTMQMASILKVAPDGGLIVLINGRTVKLKQGEVVFLNKATDH